MKRFLLNFFFLLTSVSIYAQIGYQVSLLNNATGEPRSNERVTITVKITDSEGKTVCEETKNETSNDFGVISMSIGNSETFANADWSKLPFFIEASIDGRLLGKSQLLSVPVAEHAKHTGNLTREILMSESWDCGDGSGYTLSFKKDKAYLHYNDGDIKYIFNQYIIDGNFVILYDATWLNGGEKANEQGLYYYNGYILVPINPVG